MKESELEKILYMMQLTGSNSDMDIILLLRKITLREVMKFRALFTNVFVSRIRLGPAETSIVEFLFLN